MDPSLSEADIRGVIYPYGQIVNITMLKAAKCAFVEYVDRAAAEYAAQQLYNALIVHGHPISVNWAKPRTTQATEFGDGSRAAQAAAEQLSGGGGAMLPPPGMERAPRSQYALPGMALPMGAVPPPPPPTAARPPTGPRPPEGEVGDSSSSSSSSSKKRSVQEADADPSAPTGKRPSKVPITALYPSMNPARMGSALALGNSGAPPPPASMYKTK